MNKRRLLYAALLMASLWAKTALAGYVDATNTPFFDDPRKTYLYTSTSTSSPKGTVVLMHGFILLDPNVYMEQIEAITDQGYDVIFPQFQEGGFALLLSLGVLDLLGIPGTGVKYDNWTDNACDGIEWALDKNMLYRRGWFNWVYRKPSQDLYILAHSIGGPIGYNLEHRCPNVVGNKIKGMVLANAVATPDAMGQAAGAPIPLPTVEVIDMAGAGAHVDYPIIALTGEQDEWSTPNELSKFINASQSTDVALIMAQGNEADHMAPTTTIGPIMDILWGLAGSAFGGNIVNNYLDSLYYRSAILHLMNGNSAASFDPAVAHTDF